MKTMKSTVSSKYYYNNFTVTNENTLLDNQSLGNIETPEVRYKWGRYDSYKFEGNLSLVYEKIVYWENNLLMLPSGRAVKQFYRGNNQADERLVTWFTFERHCV